MAKIKELILQLPKSIKVVNKHAPGDCVVLALVLHAFERIYPFVKINVGSGYPELFKLNWASNDDTRQGVNPDINFKETAVNGVSYPVQLTSSLSSQLKVPILFSYRPPVFKLSDHETKATFNKKYIVINSGRKGNEDCKFWGTQQWQKVVDGLKDHITVIQTGLICHKHPRLKGAVDYVGQTTNRKLLALISHPNCVGVLSHISFTYWLGVAQGKPTYTVCNAREHPSFLKVSDYSRFYFAKQGTYPCKLNNCFKKYTQENSDKHCQEHLCKSTVMQGNECLPVCALAIKPELMIKDVLKDLSKGKII